MSSIIESRINRTTDAFNCIKYPIRISQKLLSLQTTSKGQQIYPTVCPIMHGFFAQGIRAENCISLYANSSSSPKVDNTSKLLHSLLPHFLPSQAVFSSNYVLSRAISKALVALFYLLLIWKKKYTCEI